MYKYRWMVLLIFLISLLSACNNLNDGDITNIKNGEPNNSNLDNNINKTTPPSIILDNKGEIISDINRGEASSVSTIKAKIMSSDIKQINKADFEISYKNISINESTKIEEIIKKLGLPEDYEANNQGYISGNADNRRWNLCYPNYSEPEIRIIVLSEREYIGDDVKDGNSYIVGVYLEAYSTNKNLKVGDELERVLQLYGRPDSFEKDKDNTEEPYFLRYSKGNLNFDITLDKDMKKVEYIFMDYNMNKSIEEQQSENN